MATYTARIDCSTPASPTIISQSPPGWIDSVSQAGGFIRTDYTSLGLTNAPACFSTSEEDPYRATGGASGTANFSNTKYDVQFFNAPNYATATYPSSFSIVIETQD